VTPAESILVGQSKPMRRLRQTIATVAPARVPVLIEGSTGTGKELAASLLHQLSGRRGAFVAFNVCAVGDTMFEDALFGHTRGAFTGAAGDTPGFLREAHGGTVFLDEISGLPLPLQAKLLRAVETGVFRPIGSSRDAMSDFRLVAATNEQVESLVAAGRFRADLAHRLSGIVITLPTLAERLDDVPMLVEHFARGVTVTPGACRALQERAWPGNVRELKQVVDAALVFAHGVLDADAVATALTHRPRTVVANVTAPSVLADDYLSSERRRLLQLLDGAAWDTDRTAAGLGIHRSTLYRRLKRLGIALPPVRRAREQCVARDARPESHAFALIRAN
jgi:DNA-binding NtrC family response regulator